MDESITASNQSATESAVPTPSASIPTAASVTAIPRISATARPMVELLAYQRADLESDARFSWCCWSRQIGKSFTKSLRRLLRGIERRRTQIFLSAGERQSRELMLKAQQHCRALNIAASFNGDPFFDHVQNKQLLIQLPNGVRIIGLPANPTTARGFTGDVLLDEFAMHREDRQIWAAIFPTVLRGNGELDVASTPKGKDNLFAELRNNDRFSHSLVTLNDAMAAGLKIDVDAIRQSMNDEELFRQEFGCEFLDESLAFLTYEQIARIEDPLLVKNGDIGPLSLCKGELFAGVDIGRHRDLTVMWVLENRDGRLVTRCIRETAGEPFRQQSQAIHELLSLKQLRKCCIDSGGIGMPLAEAAVEAFGSTRVEPTVFTPATKDAMATQLRLKIEDAAMTIPVDESIRNDWHSIRRSIASAGPPRYEAAHGSNGHADRFWAAALAIRAAITSSNIGHIEHARGEPLRFVRGGIW